MDKYYIIQAADWLEKLKKSLDENDIEKAKEYCENVGSSLYLTGAWDE